MEDERMGDSIKGRDDLAGNDWNLIYHLFWNTIVELKTMTWIAENGNKQDSLKKEDEHNVRWR